MIWQDISGFITVTLGSLFFWLCYAARRFGATYLFRLKGSSSHAAHKNYIQEEIKSRPKPGNACYRSVQNILYSSLLSKNIKIKIFRTTILPVVLYGCETWSLTLREERRLRVFENRVLRRVFGP